MNKKLLAITISALTAFNANADALLGSKLQNMMPTLLGQTKVIVSTYDRAEMPHVMATLNVPYLSLTTLPMAGASLSKAQIQQLSSDARVKSIYYDAALEYYNYTSGEVTEGHYVHDVEGVTGAGTTIAVLDSGVDATHPDLKLGEKTIQNVKIAGDLDLAGGVNLFLEGQPNTDTSSGHGSHVGGTVAGSGEASRNDERRAFYHDGIAPGAKLVGLGAGEAISILYSLAGFDYAIANSDRYSIDVITNSWGGGDGNSFDPNNPINQASYTAYKKGIVVTFAASNSGPDDNTLNQYAIAPWVINVAAGTPSKGLADFSSRGVAGDWIKTPDITAPGSGIVSTRAINTPLPALGPIIDPDHPDYHVYYASMSGTSMATPFVAGVVGLLLEVNPDLSPDQIESVIKQSADEMPGYEVHQVGAGYINVKNAVELARNTVGERDNFLSGDTDWSSQGVWSASSEDSAEINYLSRWKSVNSDLSIDNSYKKSKSKKSEIAFSFIGDSIKLNYVTSTKNGHAEVFIDGKSKGMIDYYSSTKAVSTFSVRDLDPNQVHSVTLKHVAGTITFDGVELDGQLVEPNSRIENVETQILGNMGPSAENLQVNDHPIEVLANTTLVNAVLSWTGVADLDFELVDTDGNVVANSSSLENPEEISFRPTAAGTYLLRVNGYIAASADYTIDLTLSNMYAN
ncbi:S8 family serine peptidase [Colwellia sp. BRX10-3]|uniref:S8 family serine peptidase n=1 Tax=Colwellia sp. BRX10-3 TaxID=2759844 RepID=UPI0015F4D845|nr:S8 family serine peptidase [Colwellia sp. BRX10-3]MBA6389966.1 S8 family serine peptidase [Colwellia sp. BRX10-3]